MKVFNHINDCWAAISECKTIDEVNDLIQTFPRGLGEWWIDVEDNSYVITNRYYDGQLDDWYEDSEDLGIEVEEDDEE
jgi:hypothetical protein